MSTIAEWLASLGMSEYAERFIENKIDISVLRHLTDQDLKDICIPLGHRRKLLAAISELTGAAPATPKPAAATEPKTQDTAERRQVTVMFSDLVGSTALSALTAAMRARGLEVHVVAPERRLMERILGPPLDHRAGCPRCR